ncbi:Ribosomal large subunit pseudouridine synthase A [Rubripirellula amarantea]|uniref:Pseudouridine synthase n=1 Tax=Rubripirellula amarantea TaxID=2527999 RepID=A0A5C5WXL5_9BACT|nr:RluA family pseudouridine synthase [Rubripirellula amarantea]TWT54612.1 Ribosomal large subunit pseudouridine synthase A [Rubripirellula amarantea]
MKTIVMDPLPGSAPYENERVMRVRQAHHGMAMLDFLQNLHPPISAERWKSWIDAGDIKLGAQAATFDQTVHAGETFVHTMHDVVEPEVAAKVEIIHEDDAIIVVDKPAPLPVHSSGRFHRNTLLNFLQSAYPGDSLRMAHRLDANTTGVVVVCRNQQSASLVQKQFEQRTVKKDYVARVHGHVPWEHQTCELPIGPSAQLAGHRNTRGSRITHPDGQPAKTLFKVLQRFNDGTTLVEAIPVTGRTNQIRVHLWSLGFAIVGDPLYLQHGQLGVHQTLRVSDPPMCLHAARLTLLHPNHGREMVFSRTDSIPFSNQDLN